MRAVRVFSMFGPAVALCLTTLVLVTAPIAAQNVAPPAPPRPLPGACTSCDTADVWLQQRRALDESRHQLQEARDAMDEAQDALEEAERTTDTAAARRALVRAQQQYTEAERRYTRLMSRAWNEQMRRSLEQARAAMARMPRVSAGWIGVTLSGSYGVIDTSGKRVMRFKDYPVIESVDPGSPAERGGVESRDVLIKLAGRDVREGAVPLDQLLQPGAPLTLTVKRGETVKNVVVTVGRRPRDTDELPGFAAPDAPVAPDAPDAPLVPATPIIVLPPRPPDRPGAKAPMAPMVGDIQIEIGAPGQLTVAGAQLQPVDDLKDYFGVSYGVLVLRVLPGTPAARAGLKGGDVIQKMDGESVRTPSEVIRQMERRRSSDVSVQVVRKGAGKTLKLSVDH